MQRSVNMVLFVGIFHTGLMNHRKSDTSNLNTTSILHKGPCWIRILDHILQMIRHSLDSHEKMKISIVKPIWFSFGKIFWDFFSVLRHFTDDSCRHVDSLKLDLGIFLRQYKRFDPRIWAFFCRISAVFTVTTKSLVKPLLKSLIKSLVKSSIKMNNHKKIKNWYFSKKRPP